MQGHLQMPLSGCKKKPLTLYSYRICILLTFKVIFSSLYMVIILEWHRSLNTLLLKRKMRVP